MRATTHTTQCVSSNILLFSFLCHISLLRFPHPIVLVVLDIPLHDTHHPVSSSSASVMREKRW